MGFINQRLRDILRQTGKADVQPGAEGVEAIHQAKINLGVDREIGRKGDLLPARGYADRTFEARGPAGGEELLRVRASTVTAGRRDPDVKIAVRTPGSA